MYKLYSVKDTFALSPEAFGKDVLLAAEEALQKKYEGMIDKDMGIILTVFNVRNMSDGIIYPGDPNTHHDAEFDVLTFLPKIDEIVGGEIKEFIEFGIFVSIGPLEGLVHVSQIANDFLYYDKKSQTFMSKTKDKVLKKNDIVYAKISTVSMKNSIKDSKIALTMKPEGLGKEGWTKQSPEKKYKQDKKA
ncbi:MAG: DNA-directed RNA polymerase [Candidatus Micrarchaeaceae archaeon]